MAEGNDYAGRNETSILMAASRKLIDLSLLAANWDEWPEGSNGVDPRDATVESGEALIEGMLALIGAKLDELGAEKTPAKTCWNDHLIEDTMEPCISSMTGVSEHEIFFFDLRGVLLLEQALSVKEVAELNAVLDGAPSLQPGQWWRHVQAHSYNDNDGLNLQQIYEAGEPFERLIDHPAWIDKVKTFVGGEGTFDWHHGPLFIDENFASFRAPGEAIGMHSGGHIGQQRNQFRVLNGKFHCGQINVLMALTKIGVGDGSTLIIPASHKSNFVHPEFEKYKMRSEGAGEMPEGAVEVHMDAGDVLLFADAICHGSAKRTNPGHRRTVVYRYGPSWGNFRHNYEVSEELLTRLTPERRQIVRPRSA